MMNETKLKLKTKNCVLHFCITHTERDKVDDGEGVEEEGSAYNSSLSLSSIQFPFFSGMVVFNVSVVNTISIFSRMVSQKHSQNCRYSD